jgi:RNA polymerase sigma-70 factor, ECF subfamily
VNLFDFERELSGKSNPVASQAAKQSHEHQQRDIYESHRHRAFCLAFYMTGNEMEAEEILAATFIRAFLENERPDGFAIDSALIAELDTRFALRQEVPPALPAAASRLTRNVRRPDLEVAVRNLPPNERLLFLLHDVESYSPATIARLLDLPESKIQRICFSARIRLYQGLAEQAQTEAA